MNRPLSEREIAAIRNIAACYGEVEQVGGYVTLSGEVELVPNISPTPRPQYVGSFDLKELPLVLFHTHPGGEGEDDFLSREDYEAAIAVGLPIVMCHAPTLTFDAFCPFGQGKFGNLSRSKNAGKFEGEYRDQKPVAPHVSSPPHRSSPTANSFAPSSKNKYVDMYRAYLAEILGS